MNELYRAHQIKNLHSLDEYELKSVLESLVSPFNQNFPHILWGYERIKNRYEWVRKAYRAYQNALKMTGSHEDRFRGKIYVSGRQEAQLRQAYPSAAGRLLRNGLGVGEGITLESYDQIFSSDLHTGDDEDLCRREASSPGMELLPRRPGGDLLPTTADSCTTSTLAAMPTEVLCMIGSYFSHQDLRAITAASIRLREMFLSRLFHKSIRFSGSLGELSEKLTSFLHHASDSFGRMVQLKARYAIFLITDSDLHEFTSTSPMSPVALIGSLFGALPDLNEVVFDFRFSGIAQVSYFNNLLRGAERWAGPRCVTFQHAEFSNFNAVIRHFLPETLEAVQLPVKSHNKHYKVIKSRCRSLKGLYIDCTRFHSVQRTFRSMDHRVLELVNRDFPDIESLVMDEDNYMHNDNNPRRLTSFEDHLRLKSVYEQLFESLNAMSCLRRFSFNLWSGRIDPFFFRRDWSRASKVVPFTQSEIDTWYARLVAAFLQAVPRLEELCITNHNYFYRGTRACHRIKVDRMPFHGPSAEIGFPSVLWAQNSTRLSS
ncbi:hypothetical protein FSARC_9620 [Fusarium sarcochroum]|uniref:F-box domain-containing protein n=1 Tax=Fusarium sarcochroum TaxID=1208366 RepID=A0A8H4TQY7_9HYPO|nr:hypothetical protein FSARC_9620 [Fusarium sarcochroum]